MNLWRISNYATLSGEGGMRSSGRWHSRGRPVVYLAESPAGAMLEALVHIKGRQDKMPLNYTLLAIAAPDSISVERLSVSTNSDWKKDLQWSRGRGDEWLESGRTAILRIPSVLLPRSSNFLLNPLHAGAKLVHVEETISDLYDERLFLLAK